MCNYSSTNRVLISGKGPAGGRSWFVVGLLYPRLRVRPRPKSMHFPNAENRQRPCRMIKRHEKDPLSVRLA
ncbi:hypothetical protein TNCV_2970671 [Trichonephila clavipes]|nr:hypothetical protein TNCV_2970671 [Trichonephila clavipes]